MTINKKLFIFLSTHLIIWTLVPSITNNNLPLDTIEALAWGSNLDWGFNKHPPMSAFAVELFYQIFKNQDWSYYLLSQIFVISSFYIVYKFAEEILESKQYAFISILLLESIYFYNFTTPEFNVNICQLPFWSLAVLYSWRCLKFDKVKDYLLLGLFVSFGILSKYLFLYLALALGILFIYLMLKEKKIKKNYLPAMLVCSLVLLPHIIWLIDNDFITITYGLHRTGEEASLLDHLIHPSIFLLKQLGILSLFFSLCFFLILKFKCKINIKDKKLFFLLFINFIPIFLIFLTSLIMGIKIRTMWMTPFYLFLGVLMVYYFKNNINLKKIKNFYYVFIFLFLISPISYAYISIVQNDKRTDYNGKERASAIQLKINEWNKKNKDNKKIIYILGNEWEAGNLSYHLKDRPKWIGEFSTKYSKKNLVCITNELCLVYK